MKRKRNTKPRLKRKLASVTADRDWHKAVLNELIDVLNWLDPLVEWPTGAKDRIFKTLHRRRT